MSDTDPSRAKSFTLSFASQTGQAKAIAEEVYETAKRKGFAPQLYCLSRIDKDFSIEKEKCIVFIVSTTGDGEPPDTALKFWRRIKKRTLSSQHLSHLKFCLLALGDSNYSTFCNFGKELDRRLQQLGAAHFLKTAYGDDAVGLELAVEPWIDSLWPAIEKVQTSENVSSDFTSTIYSLEQLSNGPHSESKTPLINHYQTDEVKCLDATDSQLLKNITVIRNMESNIRPNGTIQDVPEILSRLTESSLSNETILMKANAPSPFLNITFNNNIQMDYDEYGPRKECRVPSNGEKLHWVPITHAHRLTTADAVKTVLEIRLDISNTELQFSPGDNVFIMCCNDEKDINYIIERLNLADVADLCLKLDVQAGSKKVLSDVLPNLPSPLTLRQCFKYYFDIRAVPKKAFLRILADNTANTVEKFRLEELCSRQGNDEYNRCIRNPSTSFLDVLMAFSSCQPPIERLFENLPKLQPRPYSVACSPLMNQSCIYLAFTLVKFPENIFLREREGLCSGWLNSITVDFQQMEENENSSARVGIDENVQIPIYIRPSLNFHLPEDTSIPLIMICAGTGLAPFIGFLQHREIQMKNENIFNFGGVWLFFGCRHEKKDFLYREKIEAFIKVGVLTRLFVTFSRDSNETDLRYVQDAIMQHKSDVAAMIVEKNALVYVCGDVKGMSKDVHCAIKNVLQEDLWYNAEEADEYVKEMQKNKRYIQDIWI